MFMFGQPNHVDFDSRPSRAQDTIIAGRNGELIEVGQSHLDIGRLHGLSRRRAILLTVGVGGLGALLGAARTPSGAKTLYAYLGGSIGAILGFVVSMVIDEIETSMATPTPMTAPAESEKAQRAMLPQPG